jgi:hypothetical protein
MAEKMPPQEHGRFLANKIMYEIYHVNNNIKINELAKPHFLNEGTNNNVAVINSKTGNTRIMYLL